MPTELEKMMADLKATSDQIGDGVKEAQASASKTVAPHVQGDIQDGIGNLQETSGLVVEAFRS